MTKIKLCGLKRKEDILAVNELEPEYIGFVFVPQSKRYVSFKDAAKFRNCLKESVVSVGVFVDSPVEEVADIVKSGAVSVAQLHGSEDEEYIFKLRKACDCKIIKAFGVSGTEDIIRANNCGADFCLLDTPGGGTGKPFPHDLLEGMERPYFLAGGLNSENVGELIDKYHPFGVDVSSNIETDGVKDSAKMKAFVKAVRERG